MHARERRRVRKQQQPQREEMSQEEGVSDTVYVA